MRREFARTAITILLLLGWGHAHALGLGPASVGSELSSPLQAEIPITRIAGSGIDPDAVALDVPGFNEHAQLGFPEPVLPADLEVELVRNASGGASVRLSTQRAVREPVLRFLLRATWPGGSTVREYTLLLDLPRVARPTRASEIARPTRAGAPARVAVSETPRSAVTQSPARPRAPGALTGNPFQAPAPARAGSHYGPVALGDTLHAILGSAYPGRANESLAQAIVARNPRAFVNGDPGRLLLGATLELPPAEQLASDGATTAGRTQPAAATPRGVRTASDHVVQPGDTLYAIARTVPGTGQAQLAAVARRLFEANPSAFIDGDINRLRIGARLSLGVVPAAMASAPARPTMAAAPTALANGAAPTALANGAAPGQALGELRRELDAVQDVVSTERERQSTLRERLTRTERELASLLERDAALSTDTEALRGQLMVASATVASTAPSGASAPQAAPDAPALGTSAQAVATSGSAQPTATPAPDPVPERTAPVARSTNMPAGVEPAVPNMLPNPTWLAAGAGIIALLTVLAVRRRRARMRVQLADHPRHGDEEATRRRLAEVRDAHASRARSAAAGTTPAPAATADVRHTPTARASALAKEAAVHLAYGEHGAAHTSIVEAIKLAPHQDEHKMMLMTVYQAMGKHEQARAIVDELLNRREQLSGEVRAQVEQQVKRLAR